MQDALLLDTARALQGQGRFDEARKLYRQVLKRDPRHFDAQCQLAILAYQEGRMAEALRENERALRLNPNIAGLHNNHGAFQMSLGRYADAAKSFARAVALDAGDAQARNNLAGALYKSGRPQDALAHVDAALALAPGYAKAYSDRGSVLLAIGRAEDAIASCDRALALAPNAWEAHENRALALLQVGRLNHALESFEAAAALNPDIAGLHVNCAVVLEQLGRDEEAARRHEKALALDPNARLSRGSLLHQRMRDCDWTDFEGQTAEIFSAIENGVLVSPPFPVLALPSSPGLQRKAATLYAGFVSAHVPRMPHGRAGVPKPEGDKIRIAYVSADFFNHAVGHAVAPVLEAHDPGRFEVWGVSIAERPNDDMHRRLRAAMHGYIEGAAMSDEAIAARIAELGIDIAVDLSGYTMRSRPGIFFRRPAPVQVSWLGYPGSMGSSAIDYIVADSVALPAAHERHYAEKIIRLPGSLFPAHGAREIAARSMTRSEAGLPEDAVVFCAFNNAYKITPDVFEVWMRLLNAEAGSVLWLSARGTAARANLAAEAQARGVSADRLVFASSVPLPDHLARHRLADLFLDTFHYGAHSTAADALAAGLPLLTRLGAGYPSRVAASLLNSLGLTDLVAADTVSYERKALELVRTPGALPALKARLAAAPGFEVGAFARSLEGAFERIWARYRSGKAPVSDPA